MSISRFSSAIAAAVSSLMTRNITSLIFGAPSKYALLATMTVGVAPLGGDVERALRRADEALYSAKAAGRNRLGIAGDHPAPRVVAPAVGDRHCRH